MALLFLKACNFNTCTEIDGQITKNILVRDAIGGEETIHKNPIKVKLITYVTFFIKKKKSNATDTYYLQTVNVINSY